MRFVLALLFLTAALHAEDDLFTGVPEKPVPVKIQSFLRLVQNAVESGEPAQVLRLVSLKGMTGSGWVLFRKRLLNLEKGKRVKSVEMIDGAAEGDIEIRSEGVVFKSTTRPTHTVVIRLEDEGGAKSTLELPAAEVENDLANTDRWRLVALVPDLAAESTVRIEAAAKRVEASPELASAQVEWTYLHALLGRRKEVEEGAAKLVALADGKGKTQAPYIYTQLGWCWVNLGDAKKALEVFKKASEIAEGKNWMSEFGLAVGYYLNDEPDRAVRHFEKAAGAGVALSDRAELDTYLKLSPEKERAAAFAVQSLWLRTMAPR